MWGCGCGCGLTSLVICINDKFGDTRKRNVTIRCEIWTMNIRSPGFQDIREWVILWGLILRRLGCIAYRLLRPGSNEHLDKTLSKVIGWNNSLIQWVVQTFILSTWPTCHVTNMGCQNLHWAYLLEMGLRQIPKHRETLLIVCHVGNPCRFLIHDSYFGSSSLHLLLCSELDQSRHFLPDYRMQLPPASISCVKWP